MADLVHPFRLTITSPETRRRRVMTVFAETEAAAKQMALRDVSEVVVCHRVSGLNAALARLTFRKKASVADLSEFYTSIASNLAMSPSIIEALDYTIPSTKSHTLRYSAAKLAAALRQGEPLKESLNCFRGVIPEDHIAMIAAGDSAGETATIFSMLAGHADRASKAINKARRALYYPAGLFAAGFTGLILACVFLIPKVADMVKAFRGQMPFITRMAMGFSEFLLAYPIIPVLLVLTPIVVVIKLDRIIESQLVQRLVERIPFLRRLSFKSSMRDALATFSMLVRAHVDATEALDITAQVARHPRITPFFLGMKHDVIAGANYFQAANNHRYLLGEDGYDLIPYFHIGARTGDTATLMERMSKRYQDQVDAIISGIDRMIEPVTIVMIGTLVGFIVIAVVIPIIDVGVMALPKR